MKLTDSIFINRSPGIVWSFLEKPENMPLWNPKVERVSPASFEQPRQGYRYAITYRMRERAKPADFLAEFIQYDPPAELVIRLTAVFAPHGNIIEERYDLLERDGGTLLTQTIHIDDPGMNVFFRFLIWLIQRVGKPTGTRYLETLRDLIQGI